MKEFPRFLKRMIEGACIAVVALVPLVFNPMSMEKFERDKEAVLRSLALLILAAWTILLLLERPARSRGNARLPKSPVFASLAALSLAVLLSTVFSVSPAASFWGSYATLQGTCTFLCCLAIAAAVAAHLRDPEQRERLLTASIVAGFAVALYAILQHVRGDPFGSAFFSLGGMVRSQSTLGNPIYLGGFLVMTVPIGCRRVFGLAQLIRQAPAGRPMRLLEPAVHAAIVATQVTALFFTASRGPF